MGNLSWGVDAIGFSICFQGNVIRGVQFSKTLEELRKFLFEVWRGFCDAVEAGDES